jgi:hypothetical protein
MGMVWVMFLVDILLYSIIVSYMDSVRPGKILAKCSHAYFTYCRKYERYFSIFYILHNVLVNFAHTYFMMDTYFQ